MVKYISDKQIIGINVRAIQRYSPNEIKGVRDSGAINATTQGMKQQVFGRNLYPTIERKAAFLYRNLAQKHPFQNANKRTAFSAMEMFLKINEVNFECTQDEAIQFTLRVVNDKTLTLEDITDWIKRHCK